MKNQKEKMKKEILAENATPSTPSIHTPSTPYTPTLSTSISPTSAGLLALTIIIAVGGGYWYFKPSKKPQKLEPQKTEPKKTLPKRYM